MATLRYGCALAMIFWLTACAPQAQLPVLNTTAVDEEGRRQQDMAFKEHLARLDRLDRVAWAIRAKNVDLCGENTAYRTGFALGVLGDLPKEMREAAARNAGMKEQPTVYLLAEGGPAHTAGMRRGDVLVAVDGVDVPTKKAADEALNKAMEPGKAGNPVGVAIERDGQRQNLTLLPQRICAYDTLLSNNNQVNAFADGKRIVVYSGMLKFVRTDHELAAILGHEMAHNNQGHIKAKQGNALLGALLVDLPIILLTGSNPQLGSQIGAQAYSQEFESEADYVGLYFTARAGYDYADVADIWRRMAVENPGAITMGSTHPSTSSRFVALEAARDEIKGKLAEGKDLRPEMKEKK